jgi:hypothetical protein
MQALSGLVCSVTNSVQLRSKETGFCQATDGEAKCYCYRGPLWFMLLLPLLLFV